MATTPGREKSASVARRDSWLNRREEAPPVAPPKTITVIGAGHVGVPHAVTIAKKCPGVKVTVVDDDARKIAGWNSSLLPFYEPGLQETLEEVRGTNLFFTTDMEKAIDSAQMIFVSVSTPLKDSGVGMGFAPDLQHWERMARTIAKLAKSSKVIVERSTVPVKTAGAMSQVLTAVNRECAPWVVLSNPEFSREGMAMFDQASPERIMIGGDETDHGVEATESLAALYSQWVPRQKIIASGLWSAELSKLTANAFLAQRVSSINSISALCEATGADVNEVSFAIGARRAESAPCYGFVTASFRLRYGASWRGMARYGPLRPVTARRDRCTSFDQLCAVAVVSGTACRVLVTAVTAVSLQASTRASAARGSRRRLASAARATRRTYATWSTSRTRTGCPSSPSTGST